MADAGYVYALEGTDDALRAQAERALGGACWHWACDAAVLALAEGLPDAFRERGAAFNERGELRWWRQGESYTALLLADFAQPDLALLEGGWRTERRVLLLADLDDRRYAPTFARYPTGQPAGKLEARLFRNEAGVRLLSPRRFLPPEEET